MRIHWPDIQHPQSTSFWNHEWTKHGTCAASASIDYLDTQLKYFEKALDLYKQYNLNEIFNRLKVVPSPNGIYVRDLEFRMRNLLGRDVYIECYRGVRNLIQNYFIH